MSDIPSQIKAQDEALALNHLAHGPDNASIHDFSIITRDLTRRMTNLLPDVLDEVRASFDESISTTSSDGQDVQLYTLLENASRRAGNRMFIGVPFCRNAAPAFRRSEFLGLCAVDSDVRSGVFQTCVCAVAWFAVLLSALASDSALSPNDSAAYARCLKWSLQQRSWWPGETE